MRELWVGPASLPHRTVLRTAGVPGVVLSPDELALRGRARRQAGSAAQVGHQVVVEVLAR
ncbi:hypothetical protein GCM10010441_07700 [Kitasatospora paracochleata]